MLSCDSTSAILRPSVYLLDMRGIQHAWMIYVFCLSLQVTARGGDISPQPLARDHIEELKDPSVELKSVRAPFEPTTERAESPELHSASKSSTTDVIHNSFNFPSTISASTTPSPSSSTNAIVTHSSASDLQNTPSQSFSTSTPESGSMPIPQRNLIIILTTVLGSVGVILISLAICLTCRLRKGRAPFRDHRGVTPIDDEEIESWREQKQSPALGATSPHTPRGLSIDSIALKHSPSSAWTWNALPIQHPPAAMIPQPDFVARAPNSRAGLTDEAVPGAIPFIPVPKRQSSRLSKAPPGHERTKSRKSSMSARSTRSFTTGPILEKPAPLSYNWNDNDVDFMGNGLKGDADHSSPGTSIFDGLSVAGGGLSPRPKSKLQLRPLDSGYAWDKETSSIGRAIA